MDTELNEQVVDAEAGAVPEGTGAEAATSSEATTEGQAPEIGPEIQKLIEERISKAAEEVVNRYEGKGGHLAKLRSSYDRKLAEMERKLREQEQVRVEKALNLVDTNPKEAAGILAGIVQAQSQERAGADKRQQVADWQRLVMGKLGFDLDGSEEDAALAEKWHEKIVGDDRYTYDFQQEVGMEAKRREREAREKAEKELASLQESLPGLIKAEITRALVNEGVVPEPTGGGTPSPRDENWRGNPSVSRGIAARRKRSIKRT